jgi:hypothetical protein
MPQQQVIICVSTEHAFRGGLRQSKQTVVKSDFKSGLRMSISNQPHRTVTAFTLCRPQTLTLSTDNHQQTSTLARTGGNVASKCSAASTNASNPFLRATAD